MTNLLGSSRYGVLWGEGVQERMEDSKSSESVRAEDSEP